MDFAQPLTYKTFRYCRRLGAAGVFLTALVTYLLTLEPGGSYWDCGEYVASAVGLAPGHPPGNPLFWLTGHMAAMVCPARAALCVNALSGVLSALTVMLLFLTVARLGCRLLHLRPWHDVAPGKALTIIGMATAGSLLFAWTDTFWFSAVEAEVYAFASFLTALAFWLMLVWADTADPARADRLIVLTAYVLGLSVGVHLLVLLCLPALTLIAAYRLRPGLKLKGALLGAAAGMVLIAIILYCMLPGLLRLAGYIELVAVNDFGLPFHSGVIIWGVMFTGCLTAALALTRGSRHRALLVVMTFLALFFSGITCAGRVAVSTVILALLLLLKAWRGLNLRRLSLLLWCTGAVVLGISTYGIVLLRGAAQPPMNEGEPSDIFALRSYIEREQYGKHPLFHGNTPYSEPLLDKSTGRAARRPTGVRHTRATKGGRPFYTSGDTVYEYIYQPETQAFLPRIFSRQHADGYADWAGMTDESMHHTEASVYLDSAGNLSGRKRVGVPTPWQHARFFLGYQTGYMYLRYLMWNFSGRQNDRHSQGQADAGNFLTGIPAIDDAMLGPQENLPPEIGSDNPGHNVYYLLPFALAVAGMVWQFRRGRRGRRQFNVVLTLFLMTGVAIVIYLNQTPFEPRERDYAFAGSFYAFAIWAGLGVGALARLCGAAASAFSKRPGRTCSRILAATAASAAGLGVAALVLVRNADDHNRSGRTAMPDFARNTLMSTGPHGILLTDGDNYTFPLWYLQEVEGTRTDVRVVNTSYLATPWYRVQLTRRTRGSAPLAMTAPPAALTDSRFRVIPLRAATDTLDAVEALRRLYSDTSATPRLHGGFLRLGPGAGGAVINTAADLTGGKGYVDRRTLAILDIVATNAALPAAFRRPVHWNLRSQPKDMAGLGAMTLQRGSTLFLDSVRHADRPLDLRATHRLITNVFRYGGAPSGTSTYIDPTSASFMEETRRMMLRTARALADSGRNTEALDVLGRMEREMPYSALPPVVSVSDYRLTDEGVEAGRLYCRLGEATGRRELRARGLRLIASRLASGAAYIRYFRTLDPRQRKAQTQRSINARQAYGAAAQAWLDCGGGRARLLRLRGARGVDVGQELEAHQRRTLLRAILANGRLQARMSRLTPGQYAAQAAAERRADTAVCRAVAEWLGQGDGSRAELEKYAEMSDFDFGRALKIAAGR